MNVQISFSNGWLQSFCSRHSFRQFRIHSESGSAPVEGYEEQLARIKSRILAYDPNDVYNMDETGLFYNLSPDKTIARNQIRGHKKDKTTSFAVFDSVHEVGLKSYLVD